jgi:hypothetical protein
MNCLLADAEVKEYNRESEWVTTTGDEDESKADSIGVSGDVVGMDGGR